MSSFLSGWLLRLTGAALLAAAAAALAPDGPVKKAVRLCCGLVMIAALLSGLSAFDEADYAGRLAAYRVQAQTLISGTEDSGEALVRTVIQRELESYILDKAAACGVQDAQAAVTARWSSAGYWYPETVTVSGSFDAGAQHAVSDYIAGQLGVAAAQQRWEVNSENEAQ